MKNSRQAAQGVRWSRSPGTNQPTTQSNANTATVFSSGTRIVGTLESIENIVLAGAVEGNIRTERSVHLTPESRVHGNIDAAEVLVLGEVEGEIHATQRIEIRAGAIVSGKILAPQVRIHEGVILNAEVRMSGPDTAQRHYLLPTLLKTYDRNTNPQALEEAERAAERLLQSLGFEMETRPRTTDKTDTVRPIYRLREPMGYPQLRKHLGEVERVLQGLSEEIADTPPGAVDATTGADSKRQLAAALANLRSAALLVGPVVVTRFETDGKPKLSVRVRPDSLPDHSAAGTPDPSQLLMSMQRVQTEVVQSLDATARDR